MQDARLQEIALPVEGLLNEEEMVVYSNTAELKEVDVGIQKNLLLKNDQGEQTGWIPYTTFVEQLMSKYQALSSFVQAFLATADDAITVVNEKGEIIAWNKRSEEMYALKAEDVLKKPITNFFKKEAVMLMSAITEGTSITKQYNQPKPNIHVLITALPVYLNHNIIGGISIERDISELVKLNNELSTTTAYLHDLEHNVSHEKNRSPFQKIKGRSSTLQQALTLAKKVAATDAPVLITGESGVGKELFAEGIHLASKRANKPFVAINCGAIPASLFESELFGYEQGAFTGAVKGGKKGKFDAAKEGTIFLDEIGEMPLELQVKLLRVLQEKTFYRVGGAQPIPIDVRIVAATNRTLEKMVEEGSFREDLYYRLHVISISIPPLRERNEDIPELIQLFLKEFSLKYAKPIPKMEPEVMYALLTYRWPGNIRQLRNIIERIVILGGDENEVIKLHHLPEGFSTFTSAKEKTPPPVDEKMKMGKRMPAQDEAGQIQAALSKTYGNKSAAAKLLGVSRATLYNKMKKYGLT
ncbi:sigma-54 interaction domain-containing protein [Halalkalibacterium ligniniphilum]|uniref:sigma-54 interaction domain-containing protein n=1 Tax=Halalkalibacterium ligniniphilum TaxID=1134413 RepID=UPI00034946AB|nr:sigma 54-interacting transcriptional regulator [Halalkalibacterium ligniniphilum]